MSPLLPPPATAPSQLPAPRARAAAVPREPARLPVFICLKINPYFAKDATAHWLHRVAEGGPVTYVFFGHAHATSFLAYFIRDLVSLVQLPRRLTTLPTPLPHMEAEATSAHRTHTSPGDTTTPPAKAPPTRQTPSTTASLSNVPPRAHTNLGFSCFINAALLALYAPTAVAAQLRALADACAADYLHLWQRARNLPHTSPHKNSDVALAILFSITFSCSMRPPNNKALVPRLITDLFYKASQEDVMEFLEQTLMNADICPQVATKCAGQTTSTLHCRHCPYSYSVAIEPFHTLRLPIVEEAGIPLRTVTAALHGHESLQAVDEHIQSWECSNRACQALGLHRHIPRRRRTVSHSPPVLVLHLLRWSTSDHSYMQWTHVRQSNLQTANDTDCVASSAMKGKMRQVAITRTSAAV